MMGAPFAAPFDALETRAPAERERALFAALPALLAHAQAHAPAFAALPAGAAAGSVTDRAALAALPVTRKSELLARQQAAREGGVAADVFGGF